VVDTGLGSNPNLKHVLDIGAFIDGHDPHGGADVSGHGTHVTGTIGARPRNRTDFVGIAPGCELVSARVFASDQAEAMNDDIQAAIQALVHDHKVDIINLSLGSYEESDVVADAVLEAFENGVVCVCAAGNTKSSVLYPAGLPKSYAVSALGKLGANPPGSLAAGRRPDQTEKMAKNNLYLAKFSCFGSSINGAAPGVGIISTVPDLLENKKSYASMDGTSMAAPIVSGIAAIKLSRHPTYKDMPRTMIRSQIALQALRESCVDIGLDHKYAGAGTPRV
jgi:subtilisin